MERESLQCPWASWFSYRSLISKSSPVRETVSYKVGSSRKMPSKVILQPPRVQAHMNVHFPPQEGGEGHDEAAGGTPYEERVAGCKEARGVAVILHQ